MRKLNPAAKAAGVADVGQEVLAGNPFGDGRPYPALALL
jgi:hypothetical protein